MTRRSLVIFGLAGLLAMLPSNAAAYGGGPANWQITFAATATYPGTTTGFGFWGWCELSGASDPANPSSGTEGDCAYSAYFHSPQGDVQCSAKITIAEWKSLSNFTTPPPVPFPIGAVFGVENDLYATQGSQTPINAACPFSLPFDLAPAKAAHYNGNGLIPVLAGSSSAVGEIQLQVTQIP